MKKTNKRTENYDVLRLTQRSFQSEEIFIFSLRKNVRDYDRDF
jgi:hypothetical protein